jgi:hypothetical protein
MPNLPVVAISEYLLQHRNELIVIGIAICVLLIVIVYFTFFRKPQRHGLDLMIEEQFLHKGRSLPQKEEILNALVEFDAYPSFIRILTEILNQFTLDYLYSYGELAQAFGRLVDFPKTGGGLSPSQKAAMITMIRVFMTSDFIREKCSGVLDEHFDAFIDETSGVS